MSGSLDVLVGFIRALTVTIPLYNKYHLFFENTHLFCVNSECGRIRTYLMVKWIYSPPPYQIGLRTHERMDGIEPTASAWKAEVLPLYDTRVRVQGRNRTDEYWVCNPVH